MNISRMSRNIGITAGIAIFVAAVLISVFGATKSSVEKQTVPISISSGDTAEQLGMTFSAVAAHIKPAVVSVYSEKIVTIQTRGLPFDFPFGDNFFDQLFGQQHGLPKSQSQPKAYRVPQSGMGSGMILNKQGYILTNYHVVSNVDSIRVQFADKRSFDAKIIGADPKTDVAVIKITDDVPNDLHVVELGNSDAMEVGHLVMAVGAPFGLAQTVTHGIISAKGRSNVGIAAFEDFLQTDAPINPGNSGGPLVNMKGEVIGMNSAIATGGVGIGGEGQSSGVGFAIPSNMIKAMLPTLLKGQEITRGMLGIVIQDLNKELARQFHLPDTNGALVSQVNKNSPAEKAGLKAGDVIVRFNGMDVANANQLRNFVAAATPGSSVKIGAFRDGHEQTFSATIGKMAAAMVAKPSGKAADELIRLGLSVQTLTPELAIQSGLQGEKGVLISGVDPESPASMANLQVGDLIVEANHTQVANVGEFQNALEKSPDQILLLVKRNGANLFVVIQLK